MANTESQTIGLDQGSRDVETSAEHTAVPAIPSDPDSLYYKLQKRVLRYHPSDDLTLIRKAYEVADRAHEGQMRKSGDPYIVHPLTMACHALSLGINEDSVIATILLHDVCEDCNVPLSELPVSDAVRRGVGLMTFSVMEGETKETAKTRYYNLLLESREAAITKLIDRCHNVSSMAGTFSVEKLRAYIDETRQYVLPLLRKIKRLYPEDSDKLFALKYHMTSVVDAIDETLKSCEPKT